MKQQIEYEQEEQASEEELETYECEHEYEHIDHLETVRDE
jgi:hypothetical protein